MKFNIPLVPVSVNNIRFYNFYYNLSFHSCGKLPKLITAISYVSVQFAVFKCEIGTTGNGC
jgi:hypothetical protein